MLLQELLSNETERRREPSLWSAVDLIRRHYPEICQEILSARTDERESQVIDGKLLPAIASWQSSTVPREKRAYLTLSSMKRLILGEIDYSIPTIVR